MQKILIFALALLLQTNSAWAGFFSFDWEDAGFTEEEKQAYTACNINLGVERVDSYGRKAYSVTKDGAWSWKYVGFTAEEACIFRQAGVTNAIAASIYRSCGLSTEDITEITKSPLFRADVYNFEVWDSETEKLEKGQLTVRDLLNHYDKALTEENSASIRFQGAYLYYDSKECKALKAYKDAGFALSDLDDWSYEKYEVRFSIYKIIGFKKNGLDHDQGLKLVEEHWDEISGCTTDCPEKIASLVTAKRNQMEKEKSESNKLIALKKPFLKMGFAEDEATWLINNNFDPGSVNKLMAGPCKNGFDFEWIPLNPNEADGVKCRRVAGTLFQLLNTNEGLYIDGSYYINFGPKGKAPSWFVGFVKVNGAYKYNSRAGLRIIPSLSVVYKAK